MATEFATPSTEPGKAARTTARVLTVLLTLIWCFFGTQFFFNPAATEDIHHQLGYPLYIIPVIGVTHILGGLGLLIPNMPRLTEWVYAALTVDLALTLVSHLSSGDDRFMNALHPIALAIPLAITYLIRRRMKPNFWSN